MLNNSNPQNIIQKKLLACNCIYCRLQRKLEPEYIHNKLYKKRIPNTKPRFKNCSNKHLWEKIFRKRPDICCCLLIHHTCDYLENSTVSCDCVKCSVFLNCNCDACVKYKSTRKSCQIS